MDEFFVNLGMILSLFSTSLFIISLFMMNPEKDKKNGIKVMVFAIIGLIIGFGTCMQISF